MIIPFAQPNELFFGILTYPTLPATSEALQSAFKAFSRDLPALSALSAASPVFCPDFHLNQCFVRFHLVSCVD